MEVWKESQTQKDKFRVAANILLNHCFIVKKKEDTRNEYMFILQHKHLFYEYFDLLGYTININETHGVIAISSHRGTGRLRLKKIESILLLILRLLYLEKRKELSLLDEVVVLTDEIHQKYNMLSIETKPNLDKTTLRESIRLFKRFHIVTNMDKDITLSDARIKIYPSVLLAITNENLNQVYESIEDKLKQYVSGGESNDDEEETDKD